MNNLPLTDALVKVALEAMKSGDRQRWFSLFDKDAILTDDGSEVDLTQWSERELFGKDKGYLLSVDRVEDDGLTIYGKFHSDRWGEFDTFMRFQVQDNNITRLDVGQVEE